MTLTQPFPIHAYIHTHTDTQLFHHFKFKIPLITVLLRTLFTLITHKLPFSSPLTSFDDKCNIINQKLAHTHDDVGDH